MNSRKRDRLYSSWTALTMDKGSSRVWVLWREGKFTQRLGDGVSTQAKDQFVKTGPSSFLYQIWWYPNNLGLELVSDAFSYKAEEKDGPPPYHLARLLKANKDKFRVRKERESVDTVPCHVLEWPGQMTLWLDPVTGFGIRRSTEFHPKEGTLANEYKAFRCQERAPAVWLPDRQLAITFSGGVGEKGSLVQKVIISTLKEARFNDLPDEFFRVTDNDVKIHDKRQNY